MPDPANSDNGIRNASGVEKPEAAMSGARWVPPAPARIPAMHASVQDWLSHPAVLAGTCNAVTAGQGTIIPVAPTPLDAALILHTEEAARLQGAHLFAVDPDMTRQARIAGTLLPDWSVQPDDLPAERGFLVYARPIGHSRAGEATVPIVACSWGPSPHCAPSTGGVWLTFWSAPTRDLVTDHRGPTGPQPGTTPAAALPAASAEARWGSERGAPPLWWDDEALVCWSAGEPELASSPRFVVAEDVRGVIAKDATLPWIRTVLATWLLIAQPAIVELTQQVAPRPERRRAERAGRPLPPVRVVSIHHHARTTPPAAPGPTVSGRVVRVRYPVRGFWRDQPYGKGRALRRRTWITEHWRGPEGAPVLNRPTVTVVDTPPQPATPRPRPGRRGAAEPGLG